MEAANQHSTELKTSFALLDDDHDGFINKKQLEAFMKQDKLHNIAIWKVNEIMQIHQNKMSQEDFVIWIMGCRSGLQEVAKMKFILSQNVKSLKSTGPVAAVSSTKKSIIDISINRQNQLINIQTEHFLKAKFGIDKQEQAKQTNQLRQVLGRDPSDIHFVFKLRTVDNGTLIAQKLTEIVQFAMALLSELGPTATPIVQSLKITSKWVNQYIYLVVQLNNSFFSILLKYLNELILELCPEGKCYLSAKIVSNFSKILKPIFNPLSQPIDFTAQLQMDGISLAKLKQKLIEGLEDKNSDDKTKTIFIILFENLNLSMQFQNIKECLQSFGLSQQDIPKPEMIGGEVKKLQIRQIVGQFVPEGNELLNSISQNCKPQGSISLNVGKLYMEIAFNFNIQGAFQLL